MNTPPSPEFPVDPFMFLVLTGSVCFVILGLLLLLKLWKMSRR